MKVVDTEKLYARESGGTERNDCSVQSIASAFSVPYKDALVMLEAAGRRANCGFRIVHFLEYCNFRGFDCVKQKFNRRRPTLQKFAERNRTGTWLIYLIKHNKAHMLTLKNGVLYNSYHCEEWLDIPVDTVWKVKKQNNS